MAGYLPNPHHADEALVAVYIPSQIRDNSELFTFLYRTNSPAINGVTNSRHILT